MGQPRLDTETKGPDLSLGTQKTRLAIIHFSSSPPDGTNPTGGGATRDGRLPTSTATFFPASDEAPLTRPLRGTLSHPSKTDGGRGKDQKNTAVERPTHAPHRPPPERLHPLLAHEASQEKSHSFHMGTTSLSHGSATL